ncbi:MAG: hypothetical protein AAGD07_15495 [Planctomycetota bacterium]
MEIDPSNTSGSPANPVARPNPVTLRRGPLGHRFLIWLFAALVSWLAFWLLGYVTRDIDRIEGPSYETEVLAKVPSDLVERSDQLTVELVETKNQIDALTKQRTVLQQTVTNSQQTINQLLELQKLSIENATSLSEEQQIALSDNLQAFLDRQAQSQEMGAQLETLTRKRQSLQENESELKEEQRQARVPLEDAYYEQVEAHQWRLAAYKLGLLVPFLLIIAVPLWRAMGTPFAPLSYAFAAALGGRVILVMHEHFPDEVFRYLLIGTALLVATWILYKLLRSLTRPSRQWLLKQSRDAYAQFVCPICEFPIRRGPMRFTSWTRKTLKKSLALTRAEDAAQGDEPYTCPCCSTRLFETCSACNKTRASLLPACDKCGDVVGTLA